MEKITKLSFIFLFLFLFNSSGYGQFLHIGARGIFTPVVVIEDYEYDLTDYVFYFSNNRNETFRFDGFETTITNFIPTPDIYLRFDWGNHVFFQTDVYTLRFNSEAKFKNSVDYSEFVNSFNPNAYYDNLEYNKLVLRFRFIGHSLSFGYKFLKSKRLRPFVYAGVSTLYLRNFAHRSIEDQVDYETGTSAYKEAFRIYNDILFKNMDTFKEVTLHTHAGFGFKFHGITFDFFTSTSLPNPGIDIYADKFKNDNNAYDGDITLAERANYKTMFTFNTSLSVNLFSFNLSKKQLDY